MDFIKSSGQKLCSKISSLANNKPKYYGLSNLGGTSYLNSVLQVLFMTKDFRDAVERSRCDPEFIDGLLKTLFNDLKRCTTSTYTFRERLNILREYECDAAVCFEFLISLTSPEASQIFRAELTQRNTCSTCHTETNTDDSFLYLHLELVGSDQKGYSVVDGVNKCLKASHGANTMYCEKCAAKCDHTPKLEIKHHPAVLTVQLKRFNKNDKIECSVDVPSTLQIPEDQTYELYALVDHSGGVTDGHYTATIKSSDDDKWYKFNDNNVTLLRDQLISEGQILKSKSAYLLYYKKKTMNFPVTPAETSEVSATGGVHQDNGGNSKPPQQSGKNKKRKKNNQEEKQWGGRSSSRWYHGLWNQGATCYLNSVLQVLFMTKDFRETMRSTNNELNSLFEELKHNTAETCNITQSLGIHRVNEQRDAAECFEQILTSLASPEASQMFLGQLTHRNICSTCQKRTDRDGLFWSLPLELVGSDRKGYSVVDGVEKYFKVSRVSGDNQMYCEQCDNKSDATAKRVITHHPDVLTLLLKRFKLNHYFMEYEKIECSVDIPYTLNIPEGQIYELYAFVDHVGSLNGGHYTATIKSSDDDNWFNFDDSRVTPLRNQSYNQEQIKKSHTAYLLFYKKKLLTAPETLTPHTSEASAAEGVQLNNGIVSKPSYSEAVKSNNGKMCKETVGSEPNRETSTQYTSEVSAPEGVQLDNVVTEQHQEAAKTREPEQEEASGGVSTSAARTMTHSDTTCYLNSVLQVLYITKDFREAVKRFTDNNPKADWADCFLKSFFDTFRAKRFDMYTIRKELGINPVCEQRDAAECLEKILTSLTSPAASQIFQGQLANMNKCSTCGTETNADGKRFWYLPLDLQSGCGNYSVVAGIAKFFRASDVSGDNQMYCDKCENKSDGTFQHVIKHHPEVLVLQLKTYVKNNQTVDVPCTLQTPDNQTYELYAVVDHFGGLRGGHYRATVKCQDDEKWYKFDDNSVTKLFHFDTIHKSSTAYLLFYKSQKTADSCDSHVGEVSAGGSVSAVSVKCAQSQDAAQSKIREKEKTAERQNTTATSGGFPPAPTDTCVQSLNAKSIQMRDEEKKKAETANIKYHGLFTVGDKGYLNSVLQVLFMTEDFREAVERSTSGNMDCLDHHLKDLFDKLKRDTVYSCDITYKLGFRVYEQHDAAEYFEKILNLTSPAASQIFRGELTHKTICSSCQTEKNSDVPFWCLSLPLLLMAPYNKIYQVLFIGYIDEDRIIAFMSKLMQKAALSRERHDCYNSKAELLEGIKEYFRDSHSSGENQMYCDQCKVKVDITVKKEIKHHPEVLMLQLKRFEFNGETKRYVKIDCDVHVPYTLQIPQNKTYELYAFVDHCGNTAGYCTATIKSQHNEKWYKFDGTRVTLLDYQPFQVDNTEKLKRAHLFFYRKVQTHAADTYSPDMGEASARGGSMSAVSDNCEQSQDVDERTKGTSEDRADVDNHPAQAVSVNRSDNAVVIEMSSVESPDAEEEAKTEMDVDDDKEGKIEGKLLKIHDLMSSGSQNNGRQNMAKDDQECIGSVNKREENIHEQHKETSTSKHSLNTNDISQSTPEQGTGFTQNQSPDNTGQKKSKPCHLKIIEEEYTTTPTGFKSKICISVIKPLTVEESPQDNKGCTNGKTDADVNTLTETLDKLTLNE